MSLDTGSEENNESPDTHGAVAEDRDTSDIQEVVTEEVKIENLLILNTIGTGAEHCIYNYEL